MADQFGIGFERLEVKELAPTGTTRVLDVKGIELADAITSRNEVMKTQWKADDIATGVTHFALGVLLPVPLILCAFISEDYASLTSADAWCDLELALVAAAWRGPGCVRKMHWWNYFVMHVALLMWIAALLAAHAHYIAPFVDPFADDTEKSADNDDAGGAM